MAYNTNRHLEMVERIENVMRAFNDAVVREMAELADVYAEEAGSGTHASFVAVGGYTKAELQDAFTAFAAFDTSRTTHLSKVTPFLLTQ